jgi:Barrel-sandwich domain of CusB or HlyD membrane-fusion/MacB-like periplasmic core domain
MDQVRQIIAPDRSKRLRTHKQSAPLKVRRSPLLRWRTMARVALRMMLHDKLKMAGTLAGVVFAVVLANQQVGTFLGLLHKNTMFIDHAGADIWVVPPATPQLQFGEPMQDSVLMRARVTPGVAWAEPLLYGGATLKRMDGGSQPVTLVGTRDPHKAGGPWNLVAGDVDNLRMPDTVIFEHAEREKFGGINLGSVRELSGRKVKVGGFTWGLLPFGPSYAFADYELAREVLRTESDELNFVLIKVLPGADSSAVSRSLQSRIPEAKVLTQEQFKSSTIEYVLTSTAIGVAEARAQLARSESERAQRLASDGAISLEAAERSTQEAEALEATSRAARARANAAKAGSRPEDIAASRSSVKAASARVEEMGAHLERLRVVAPFDGEILQVKFRPGEYFDPRNGEPLLIVGDTSELHVRMDVDERDVGRVRMGAPAFVTAEAFAGKRFEGKIIEVGRHMGRKNVRTDEPTERLDTKILEVLVALNESEGLVPGMRVSSYVEFETAR